MNGAFPGSWTIGQTVTILLRWAFGGGGGFQNHLSSPVAARLLVFTVTLVVSLLIFKPLGNQGEIRIGQVQMPPSSLFLLIFRLFAWINIPLACLIIFCWKPGMLYWVMWTEVNRPSVWGLNVNLARSWAVCNVFCHSSFQKLPMPLVSLLWSSPCDFGPPQILLLPLCPVALSAVVCSYTGCPGLWCYFVGRGAFCNLTMKSQSYNGPVSRASDCHTCLCGVIAFFPPPYLCNNIQHECRTLLRNHVPPEIL